MPRIARAQCESGIYHVMIRGINQVQLFYDDSDRQDFLKRLALYKTECRIRLYAWCLMGNHVHLLVKQSDVPLASFMKKLLLSYSHLYNAKYDRQGYLYQGRYVCKPVDNDSYFLAALRYIHRNPVEIGMPVSYWTSYSEYTGSQTITETQFALSILSTNPVQARELFKRLINADETDLPPWNITARSRLTDAEAIEVIKAVANIENCQAICDLKGTSQANVIATIRKQGVSTRQLARLTGLARRAIEQVKL